MQNDFTEKAMELLIDKICVNHDGLGEYDFNEEECRLMTGFDLELLQVYLDNIQSIHDQEIRVNNVVFGKKYIQAIIVLFKNGVYVLSLITNQKINSLNSVYRTTNQGVFYPLTN